MELFPDISAAMAEAASMRLDRGASHANHVRRGQPLPSHGTRPKPKDRAGERYHSRSFMTANDRMMMRQMLEGGSTLKQAAMCSESRRNEFASLPSLMAFVRRRRGNQRQNDI